MRHLKYVLQRRHPRDCGFMVNGLFSTIFVRSICKGDPPLFQGSDYDVSDLDKAKEGDKSYKTFHQYQV